MAKQGVSHHALGNTSFCLPQSARDTLTALTAGLSTPSSLKLKD